MPRWNGNRSHLFSLFVDNLHQDLDSAILWKYFKREGDVKDIYIPKALRPGRRDKYGFARFSDPREAREVASRCNGDSLWGRRLLVKMADDGGYQDRQVNLGYRNRKLTHKVS